MSLIGYRGERIAEVETVDLADVRDYLDRFDVTWVNVDGLGDGRLLHELAELFGMHALALEDVVHVGQRPKVEIYEEDLFIVAQMVSLDDRSTASEQISLYLTDRCVITFQERPGDCLEPVRQRLRAGHRRRLRERGPDYLAYAILDAVIDHYFPTLEEFQDRLEAFEERLREGVEDPHDEIRGTRRDLQTLRQAIQPTRDATRLLAATELPRITAETQTFLRDCHDHVLEAVEQLESCREIASGLMDLHLAAESHRANETMKVLTLVATIFMPLSFLAGVYGMNFDSSLPGNMPELSIPYGYVGLLGIMLVLAVLMLIFFRRNRWL